MSSIRLGVVVSDTDSLFGVVCYSGFCPSCLVLVVRCRGFLAGNYDMQGLQELGTQSRGDRHVRQMT